MAGKTTLFNVLTNIFGSLTIKSSGSSAAGIRQAIKSSSKVILCDDARIQPGRPCRVRVTSVRKPASRERGFVETVFGRRLYVGDINASNFSRRQYAERTAINAPMQGTAADLIKMAMLAVDRWITQSGADARVILQVHDELVLEVAKDAVAEVRQKLVELMSGVGGLSVDLVVDTGVGENWAQAHS